MIHHQHHEGWPTSGEGAQTFAARRRAQAEETSPPAYHRSVISISHKAWRIAAALRRDTFRWPQCCRLA